MTAASCLYEGVVAHRRTQPARDFRHPLTMAYIDLDELPELLGARCAPLPGLCVFVAPTTTATPAWRWLMRSEIRLPIWAGAVRLARSVC